ncbi:MAG: 4Fe-4S binding protein [Actinobacteria bacterium]|nr:4Fe-4S binding protein [Actinomycetota bacterium]
MSFELGADFLKVPYTGNEESFEGVIKAAKGVPVLVLGGARSDRYQDAIDMAMDAKSAGAKGIVFGRNVTQSKDPELIISKLYDLFHGASIEKKKFLKKKVIIKSELCTNCNLCAVACSFRHTGRQGLDGSTIIINHNESKSIYPKIHICNQCGKCINVCKKEALHFLKEGGISLDPGKCNGCGECTRVCPQGVIKMDNNNHIPYVCDLCNGEPECVLACPTGALSIKEIC